jgi:hypothetical protein
VDFRARTAASYGHAFVWYGKTGEKDVEVAGLHPAGDTLPYILGHLTWVPSETGASYGDLDEQYLTASYRVYLSEADAKKVFSYIKHLQATSPLWNAETTNCTNFIGRIASFMGLQVPFHLIKPEEYVNELKALNDGRQTVQLDSDRELASSWFICRVMLVSKHSDSIQVVVIGRSARKRVAFIGAAILAALSDLALSQAQNRLLRDALRRIRMSRSVHTRAADATPPNLCGGASLL